MSKLETLKSRLIHLEEEKEDIIKEMCMHYHIGELIMYRSNPNPAVDALQLARIVEVFAWGLNVERYRPDGSKMKGLGHIRGTVLASVIKVPHLDVDSQ